MPNGLLFGADEQVAQWAVNAYRIHPMRYDRAIGIVSPAGNIVGAIFFQAYNGHNFDLGYYGHGTVTLGIVRSIARIALVEFNAARCTMITSKKNKRLVAALHKIGMKIEGSMRCYYGRTDCQRNTGIRLVMFRDVIEQLADPHISLTKVAIQ